MSSSRERGVWLERHVLPHEPALRAWLRGRYLKGLEIDDIVQETYARLAEAESLQHVRCAKSYAFQTASSVIADHLRRMKINCIFSVANLEDFSFVSSEPSPEVQAIDLEELQRLAKVVARLPEQVRQVFTLRRVHALSQREVSIKMGISESTVEKHMSRGFFLVTDLFAHDECEPPDSRAEKLARTSARAAGTIPRTMSTLGQKQIVPNRVPTVKQQHCNTSELSL